MRKTSDYVLAGLFTAGGVLLMVENLLADGDSGLAHPVSSTSWVILPVFLLATVPILWRRRNILAVIGVTVAAMALHVVAFGWLTRCGVGLPLAAALAYAVARFAGGARNQAVGLAGVAALIVVTLVRDSSIGGLPGGLEVGLPAAALFYGIGFAVQNRVAKKQLVTA
ncbi:hypothetical protein [Actinoplanes sp. M2I2]|uniref:hypothetical protein n=1 Tax=Actinoplanes sp. M2I2 TaxID=1734444 RepID=UPI0020226EFE|nr:hypothetical protein [Actinoplanes sp. M2I2]